MLNISPPKGDPSDGLLFARPAEIRWQTHLADAVDLEQVLRRARDHREHTVHPNAANSGEVRAEASIGPLQQTRSRFRLSTALLPWQGQCHQDRQQVGAACHYHRRFVAAREVVEASR